MAGPLRALVVLLVQPHGDNLRMYGEYLRSQGITCIPVTTSVEALARAAEADVVVTGILLSGPDDGIDLIQRLRRDDRTRALPVIVLTACVFETERRRAEDAGCQAFLPKPCLPETLLAEIQRVLVPKAQLDKLEAAGESGRRARRRTGRQ